MSETIYVIDVRGDDYDCDEDGWAGLGEPILQGPSFHNLDEAIGYLLSITTEQALAWEKMSDCNGLDIQVFEYDGDDYAMIAECEWIEDGLNGIWVGFDRIA